MWLFFLAMIINLIDGSRWARFSWPTREWGFRCLAIWAGVFFTFSLGLRPMYRFMYFYSTLFVRHVSGFWWHRGVPCCRGCVNDPKTTLLYYHCV